jgi:DNA-binding transcriptional regulator YiaG
MGMRCHSSYRPAQPLTFYTKSCKIKTMVRRKVNRPYWDGASIHALRRHLALTQSELAERLGTRQQTISEWEKGMYQPRGASATLLSIVAERAKFKYQALPVKEPTKPD